MSDIEEKSRGRLTIVGLFILMVTAVFVIVGLPFLVWRINLLADNQNLLLDSLTVKSQRLSQANAREYMKSQGYVLDPGPQPQRDYFYLGRRSASRDLTSQSVRAYVEYKAGLTIDAGVEVMRGYF